MNSLERSIARRREAEAEKVSCVELGSLPTLGLHKWEAGQWLLPWSHLDSMVLGDETSPDAIGLAFTRYRVAVTGENLAAIWTELARLNVATLRELPATYRQRVALDTAFITSIVLTEVSSDGDRG